MYWVFGLVCENSTDHWLENGTDVLLQEFFCSGHFDNYLEIYFILFMEWYYQGKGELII
jgi:hypothetical protein